VFNVFGELTSRKTAGGNRTGAAQEKIEYDLLGRVWRSNSTDGITRVWIYDRAGRATVQIESQDGTLGGTRTAKQIYATPGQDFQTTTIYDARGNVTKVIQPEINSRRPNVVNNVRQVTVQSGQFDAIQAAIGSSLAGTSSVGYLAGPTQTTPTAAVVTVPPVQARLVVRSEPYTSFGENGLETYYQYAGLDLELQIPPELERLVDGNYELSVTVGSAAPATRIGVTGTWVIPATPNWESADPYSQSVSVVLKPANSETPISLFRGVVRLPPQTGTVSAWQTGDSQLAGTFLRMGGGISTSNTLTLMGSGFPVMGGFPGRSVLTEADLTSELQLRPGYLYMRMDQGFGGRFAKLHLIEMNGDTVVRRESVEIDQWSANPIINYSTDNLQGLVSVDRTTTPVEILRLPGLLQSSTATTPPSRLVISSRAFGSSDPFLPLSASVTQERGIWTVRTLTTPGVNREWKVELYDSNGTLSDTLIGRVDGTAGVVSLRSTRFQPSSIVFTGIPSNAASFQVNWNAAGQPPKVRTVQLPAGATSFTWDTTEDGLIPDRSLTYSYSLTVRAFDRDGGLLSEAQGGAIVGAIAGTTTATLVGIVKPRLVTIDPVVSGGVSMRVRIAGPRQALESRPLYGTQVVTSIDVNGEWTFAPHYSAPVLGLDSLGRKVYGRAVAVPYDVVEPQVVTYEVTVQDIIGWQPVVVGSTPVYETRIGTRTVEYIEWVQEPTYITGEYGWQEFAGYISVPVTRYSQENYEYQAYVGMAPIYQKDAAGNIIYLPVYQSRQETRQRTDLVTRTITPENPDRYIIGYKEQAVRMIEATPTRLANGRFQLDATHLDLSQVGSASYRIYGYDESGQPLTIASYSYEYTYDVLDAAGRVIGTGNGFVEPDNDPTNDAANLQTAWIVEGLAANTVTQIQRRQTFNAFGEIRSQEDGRKNVIRYEYDTAGHLVRRVSPTVQQREGNDIVVPDDSITH
jgi:YD repeat-containing protein